MGFLAVLGSSVYNAAGAPMSRKLRQEAPEAGSLAFTFVALVLVCTGIGYLADYWLHTLPWLMVAGVFVGATLGFAYLVFILFSGASGNRAGKRPKEPTDGQDEEQGGRSS